MEKTIKALGHEIKIQPQEKQQAAGDSIRINDIKQANEILRKYKDGKRELEDRIVENEAWYRLRHWEYIKAGNKKGVDVESKTAWLFNSIFNKHADAMDNYPEPNILPREKGDVQEAETLTKIVPLIMEHNKFEKTYSDGWWYKLKHGCVPYGVFWDSTKENGLGDISIKRLDLMNIFWEPGIADIQESSNLFICELEDIDILKGRYPAVADQITGSKNIEIKEYATEDQIDNTQKALVVDWYYKTKNSKGDNVLQYVKFTGETVLYDTEQSILAEEGLYQHGLYPVFFDVLFPLEGTPAGFGFIDLCKNTQLHIDKLDSIILQNSYENGVQRYFGRSGMGINKDQFADYSNRIVEFEGGNPNEDLRAIETRNLPAMIINHRQAKIDELKETSGNRDVSQGGTSGGVTAAAAIAALQEAGNKLSRDIIKGAYRCYTDMCYMVIELIRQFYDETREFRITGQDGQVDFIDYQNTNLKLQPLPEITGQETRYKQSVFDIKVKAQKANPYSRMSQNELAKELFAGGYFNPQNAEQALIALEMMDFEGKQTVVEKISNNRKMYENLQRLTEFAETVTGLPIGQMLQAGQPMPNIKAAGRGAAMNPNNQSYAERIANRARTNIEEGGAGTQQPQ